MTQLNIKEGLNLLAHCLNPGCATEEVVVHKALPEYGGSVKFNLNMECAEAKCPECATFLDDVQNIGFYRCEYVVTGHRDTVGKVAIKGRSSAEDEVSWLFADGAGGEEAMEYRYLNARVWPIEHINGHILDMDRTASYAQGGKNV